MTKNRIIRLALTAVAALSLALFVGCSKPQEPVDPTPTPDPEPAPTSIVVVDAYGRTVEVPVDVQRVATVGSGARFVVYAGAQDKLVAVTDMEKPTALRPYTVAWSGVFAELPSTSNGNHLNATEIDNETLLTLAPDVIISSRSAEECDTLQTLLQIPVIGIKYENEIFTDNVFTSILCVGQACGTLEHAQTTVDALKGFAEDLDKRVSAIARADADKAGIYIGCCNFKGRKGITGTDATYPVFSFFDLNNVAAASGNSSNFDTTIEQIGAWNPAYIFVDTMNRDRLQDDIANHGDYLKTIAACAAGNVYGQAPFNMNGTNIEYAVCDIYFVASVLYPEAFQGVDMASVYDQVFTALLGKPMYAQLAEAGITLDKVNMWDL